MVETGGITAEVEQGTETCALDPSCPSQDKLLLRGQGVRDLIQQGILQQRMLVDTLCSHDSNQPLYLHDSNPQFYRHPVK